MMAQYLEIKAGYPHALLFYRMGDFYELFHEDAVVASAALDITLTKRGKHEGADIAMCGVPVHSADGYLSRLIRKGFKVAVCEQVENPAEAKKRGGKSVVRRDVVRLVTPGTLTEDELLDARNHNFLAALAETGGSSAGRLGLAWLDMSTGDFHVQPLGYGDLGAVLARLAPGEMLVSDRLAQRPELFEVFAEWKDRLTTLPASRFDSENAKRRVEAIFEVKALDAYGEFERAELAAVGALLDYVELTQKGRLPRLVPPRRQRQGSVMEVDAATRRNLELSQALSGGRAGTLLATIDRTVTGAGARLLASWLASPLTDAAAIAARLDVVDYLVGNDQLREELRRRLRLCPDIARALSRLSLGRGGPRDLAAVRDALSEAGGMRAMLADKKLAPLPEKLASVLQDLGFHDQLVDRLQRALSEELPLLARDGGFIAQGYDAKLDEYRGLRDESRRLIAALQSRYAEETGITNLKIRHNNVLGYYIEVTPTHAPKMPTGQEAPFIHRQTLASAVRYSTVELSELQQEIASAADKAQAIEMRLFEDLVGEIDGRAEVVALAAGALATLDVAAALSELALQGRWCRPKVDNSSTFDITAGRHPVVEAALAKTQEGSFVANNCNLADEQRLWLITGPNMAGKSTFLRQNALIAILAQMGSFVPADAAHIGVIDRLFSRVGAADDLARGRSTFMVEMVETAVILNQATPRSLVILDEIGRGTATFDGLSIAWACVEHLHEVNRSRALFATHYHELTTLSAKLTALACHAMRVKEWQGEVIFLHEVAAGAADRSYGIHVAKLAGLPNAVVSRAEEVLATLEQGEQAGVLTRLADDLPLFAAALAQERAPGEGGAGMSETAPAPSAVEERLSEINPDDLTPRQALELLYALKTLSGRE
ncbi:DNA mismatch repair protein MutS [Pelagibius sp. Alg239-R121]|uniref:DNA mismatch repair protein MutS n=1 Tax=Pelagibius sp. Alg239-R121 TaxID=2993448 RepID=UPI002AC361FC|nr:DNA mismatch repair protein MutS [Pelagibius sp. Alg239-R121]